MQARSGGRPVWRYCNSDGSVSDDGSDGVDLNLFKPRAKLPQCKKLYELEMVSRLPKTSASLTSEWKICDSLIYCASHKE
jgi:hypothetical protein